jgi:hypothetical protein
MLPLPYNTRWFKYDRDWLCVNKSQFVPVIFEPPCIKSVSDAAVCKSDYRPSETGPRIRLQQVAYLSKKIMFKLDYKTGHVPFCFSGPYVYKPLDFNRLNQISVCDTFAHCLGPIHRQIWGHIYLKYKQHFRDPRKPTLHLADVKY